MTLCVAYASKKAMKECIGKPLRYIETSPIVSEYLPNGRLTVAGRPFISSVVKREFFAIVTMKDGLITRVE